LLPLVDDHGDAAKLSDSQVDDILNRGAYDKIMQEMMQDTFYGNDGSLTIDQLLSSVADLEDRHQQILLLERQILELLELFKDLDLLVDVADEKLDIIGYNIDAASTNVKKAETVLKSAEKSSKKCCCLNVRSTMCCLFLLLILAIVFIVLFAAPK
jgi:hypothetical protein